jgi:hypothetical protein
MSDRAFVVYYRVSPKQQKRSGLGLLAQQDSAQRYITANPGRVLAELTEIESGRSRDRPQLKEALRLCRVYDAKLIIARLDRLARSIAMIAGLLESDVDFVAADMRPVHDSHSGRGGRVRGASNFRSNKSRLAAAKARGRNLATHGQRHIDSLTRPERRE